ncbi:MAG: hypothetical protein F7C07_04585 [Desulfurococcales archaeon]|nr:hypothetical protein [Desulfurococcales archaeon]
MLSREPSRLPDPKTLASVVEFASKLTGFEYLVASAEGLPIAYTGTSREKAESMAALSVDIVEPSYKVLREIVGQEPGYVYINIDEGRALAFSRTGGLILVAYGKTKVLREALNAVSRHLAGTKIKCGACGGDLTLATHKCPHCKSTIPFISSECPLCGATVSVKKCPYCKTSILIDRELVEAGRPVAQYTSRKVALLALTATGSVAAGIISGYAISQAWGIDAGILSAIGVGGLVGLIAEVLALRKMRQAV